MGFVRRSLKAYIIAICVFVMLTLALAAMLRFTSFDEDWTMSGLVAALAVASLLLGIMEGNIVGRRGLPTGFISSVVFLCIIMLLTRGVFAGSSEKFVFQWAYMIPVLSGTTGGVLGINGRKS